MYLLLLPTSGKLLLNNSPPSFWNISLWNVSKAIVDIASTHAYIQPSDHQGRLKVMIWVNLLFKGDNYSTNLMLFNFSLRNRCNWRCTGCLVTEEIFCLLSFPQRLLFSLFSFFMEKMTSKILRTAYNNIHLQTVYRKWQTDFWVSFAARSCRQSLCCQPILSTRRSLPIKLL